MTARAEVLSPAARVGRRRMLAASLVALGVLPFVLATGSRTPVPPRATEIGQGLPALPRGGEETNLLAGLDALPVLVAPPDDESRRARDAFVEAGMLDARDVLSAFDAAWAALPPVADAAEPALAELRTWLLDPDVSGELAPSAHEALDALATDPANGERLVNIAAMLFVYGALFDAEVATTPADSFTPWPHYSVALETQAAALLEAVGERWGVSRHQLLNLALVLSVTDMTSGLELAVDSAAAAVAESPEDTTARLVLASLQSRRPAAVRGWEDALDTLAPLLEDPRTETLGLAARGDAFLGAAAVKAADAPRSARVLARWALDEYRQVLEAWADPGVYAGWARAAAILGDTQAASDAMDVAVDLAPDAVDLRIDQAALAEANGDPLAMRDAARAALDHIGSGWNPSVAGLRFVASGDLAHRGDLGLFGASVGSTLDHVAIVRDPSGAGILADLEVVPKIADPSLDLWRRGRFAPDVAAVTAVQASVVLGEPDEAAADHVTWRRDRPSTAPPLAESAQDRLQLRLWAAELVAFGALPRAATDEAQGLRVTDTAQLALRRVGDFATAQEVCEGVLRETTDGLDRVAVMECIGDAQALQGLRVEAAATYKAGIDVALYEPTDLQLKRGAMLLAEAPGDEGARTLLNQVAVRGEAAALVLLGGDDLAAGRPAVARTYFDLASALLDPEAVDSADMDAMAELRQSHVHTHTNRGVALLRQAQDDPDRPPRCDSGPAEQLCLAAAADFDAALAIDPLNPIILMDAGWAARALGRTGDAARRSPRRPRRTTRCTRRSTTSACSPSPTATSTRPDRLSAAPLRPTPATPLAGGTWASSSCGAVSEDCGPARPTSAGPSSSTRHWRARHSTSAPTRRSTSRPSTAWPTYPTGGPSTGRSGWERRCSVPWVWSARSAALPATSLAGSGDRSSSW